MPNQRYKPEQIVNLLRKVEVKIALQNYMYAKVPQAYNSRHAVPAMFSCLGAPQKILSNQVSRVE